MSELSQKDKELEAMLYMCSTNTKYCGKALFRDIFSSPFSTLHDAIFEKIDSDSKKKGMAAPRGIGKTSIAKTKAMQSILFRKKRFIVYIMNTATSAGMQTENIKRELITNQTIRTLFGDIRDSDFEAYLDDEFSKEAWVAFGHTLVLPRGAGQQVRGLNWRNYRPDLIICDDLENKDEIKSAENREKIQNWFDSDVLKSVDQFSKDYEIIYIDTLKHEDSLLQDIIDSPQWDTCTLSICNDKYETNDPNYMTTEEIMLEVEEARRTGRLDSFYLERMNMPVGGETASFKSEYFKYYLEQDLSRATIENIVIVDPAKTVTSTAADTAIVGIGIDTKNNSIYIRDIVSAKLFPDQIMDEMFLMAARLGAKVIGYEDTGLGEFARQPIMNEAIRRGIKSEIIFLHARGGSSEEKGKSQRIKTLVPYYRQGLVFHNRNCCGKLENQLLSFPRSKLWDVMDATAYVVEMMELGGRYFEAMTGSEDDYDNPSEDEYADITNDSRGSFNWRLC